jgi:hypothetical protein
MSCIKKFHPKEHPVLGIIDGEDLERLWSTLGNFSVLVRNMSREGRREQLEDALISTRVRGLKTLPSRLKKKLQRTHVELNLKKDILISLKPVGQSLSEFESDIQRWMIDSDRVESSSQEPVSRIAQMKAFISSRYRLLKSRKEDRGQIYLQKIMRSISETRKAIQALVTDEIEEDDDEIQALDVRMEVCRAWKDYKRTQQEIKYLELDLARLNQRVEFNGDPQEEKSGKLHIKLQCIIMKST